MLCPKGICLGAQYVDRNMGSMDGMEEGWKSVKRLAVGPHQRVVDTLLGPWSAQTHQCLPERVQHVSPAPENIGPVCKHLAKQYPHCDCIICPLAHNSQTPSSSDKVRGGWTRDACNPKKVKSRARTPSSLISHRLCSYTPKPKEGSAENQGKAQSTPARIWM